MISHNAMFRQAMHLNMRAKYGQFDLKQAAFRVKRHVGVDSRANHLGRKSFNKSSFCPIYTVIGLLWRFILRQR